MSYKSSTFGLLGILAGVFLMSTLQYVIAWTGPTETAPNGNVSGPVTVSALAQTKVGNFSTNNNLYAGGLISAPTLCIGSDCKTAWPNGASSGPVTISSFNSLPSGTMAGICTDRNDYFLWGSLFLAPATKNSIRCEGCATGFTRILLSIMDNSTGGSNGSGIQKIDKTYSCIKN